MYFCRLIRDLADDPEIKISKSFKNSTVWGKDGGALTRVGPKISDVHFTFPGFVATPALDTR